MTVSQIEIDEDYVPLYNDFVISEFDIRGAKAGVVSQYMATTHTRYEETPSEDVAQTIKKKYTEVIEEEVNEAIKSSRWSANTFDELEAQDKSQLLTSTINFRVEYLLNLDDKYKTKHKVMKDIHGTSNLSEDVDADEEIKEKKNEENIESEKSNESKQLDEADVIDCLRDKIENVGKTKVNEKEDSIRKVLQDKKPKIREETNIPNTRIDNWIDEKIQQAEKKFEKGRKKVADSYIDNYLREDVESIDLSNYDDSEDAADAVLNDRSAEDAFSLVETVSTSGIRGLTHISVAMILILIFEGIGIVTGTGPLGYIVATKVL